MARGEYLSCLRYRHGCAECVGSDDDDGDEIQTHVLSIIDIDRHIQLSICDIRRPLSYPEPMYVHPESLDEELQVSVDAAMELANVISDDPPQLADRLREVLTDHEFTRAAGATSDDMTAFADRVVPISRLVASLADSPLINAVEAVNAELESCAIAPSLSAHDDFPLHIHWTSSATPFAHQVVVDLLMAIAQTLCDHGTERFGRCAADDCGDLFYDTTKNRSRRFCSDPRCASRTHTAAHRARQALGAEHASP